MTVYNNPVVNAENVNIKAGSRWLVQKVCMTVRPGEVHVIMGANGAGKSTLLKSLSGTSSVTNGDIFFHQKPLKQWSPAQLATYRAFLSQHHAVSMPFSAYEIIAMGRYAHGKTGQTIADRQIIANVSAITHTTGFWPQNYLTLSGGERQRVQLARVLAQLFHPQQYSLHGKLLLLDEPVTALDIRHQFQVMETICTQAQMGLAVVCVLHDIGIAMQYATHVHLMKQGKMIYQAPVEAISAEMISETFDVPVTLQHQHGRIMVQVYAA